MVECTYPHYQPWMGLHLRVGIFGSPTVLTPLVERGFQFADGLINCGIACSTSQDEWWANFAGVRPYTPATR
jgi:hypothetical protein